VGRATEVRAHSTSTSSGIGENTGSWEENCGSKVVRWHWHIFVVQTCMMPTTTRLPDTKPSRYEAFKGPAASGPHLRRPRATPTLWVGPFTLGFCSPSSPPDFLPPRITSPSSSTPSGAPYSATCFVHLASPTPKRRHHPRMARLDRFLGPAGRQPVHCFPSHRIFGSAGCIFRPPPLHGAARYARTSLDWQASS
jgi:hypothetical protein